MERPDKHTEDDLREVIAAISRFKRFGDDGGVPMSKREIEAVPYYPSLHTMEFLKAETLASISHELRGPLAAIKGYTATLLRYEQRLSSQERHEFLLAINESCERLVHIVNAFLEMSELETGAIVINRCSVHIERLVREAITVIEQRLKASGKTAQQPKAHTSHASDGLTFALQLVGGHKTSAHDDLIIQADHRLLREVLDQVLENAVTHAQKRGTINVAIHPHITQDTLAALPTSSQETERKLLAAIKQHEQMIAICVSDEGKGIEPHLLERIFDRFYQIDTHLTREVNGLGLGLAMCKHIVELHEGVMWAESEVGKGSTFFVLLPCRSGENENGPFVHTSI